MIGSTKYTQLHTVVFAMRPDCTVHQVEICSDDQINPPPLSLPYQSRLTQISSPSQKSKSMIRAFFGEYVKKEFVKQVAQDHLLDNILSKKDVKNAKEHGILPTGFSVHHVLPISFGGRNHLGNLCVAEEMVHMALHQLVWDKINQEFYWDKERFSEAYMFVPTNKRVITNADMSLFFSAAEITRFKKKYKRWKRAVAAAQKMKAEQKQFSKAKPKKATQTELHQKYFANRKKMTEDKTFAKKTKKKTVARAPKSTDAPKTQEKPLLLPAQKAYKAWEAKKKKMIADYKEKVQKEQRKPKKRATVKDSQKTSTRRLSKTKLSHFVAKRQKKANSR